MRASMKVALALAVVVGVWFAWRLRRGGDEAAEPSSPPVAQISAAKRAVRFTLTPAGPSMVEDDRRPAAGTLSFRGIVVDERNVGILSAEVAIDTAPPTMVNSGPDGRFAVPNLGSRRYRLEARKDDRFAGPMEVELGPETPQIVLRALPATELTVRVLAADGSAPVSGAEVNLRSVFLWHGTTDAVGTLVVTGVGPGWRALRVDAEGFATYEQMITTAAGVGSQEVSVRLARGGSVEGRVVTTESAPVGNARVWARRAAEPFPVLDPAMDAVISGQDGRFKLRALAPGSYQFVAAHPDHAESSTPPIQIEAGGRSDVEIKVERGGVLTGEVRSIAGEPVPSAQVRLVGHGEVAWRFRRETSTDDRGAFRLTGLPRRSLDVMAVGPGGSSGNVAVDLSRTVERHVELTLTIAEAIEGVVIDMSGNPVADAQVVAEPEFRSFSERAQWTARGLPGAFATLRGAFRISGLPAGNYLLRAAAPGASPDTLRLGAVTKARTGDTGVKVRVAGAGTVKGRVAFEDGSVPQSFSVALGTGGPRPVNDAAGRFELTAPAGSHDVTVSGTSFVSTTHRDVSVEAGGVHDVGVLHVKKGRSISGRVLFPDGAAAAGAAVVGGRMVTGTGTKLSVASEGHDVQEATSDENGRFTLTGFDDRPMNVQAELAGKGRSQSVAIPRSSQGATIDLVLQPVGSLEGAVTRHGRPLAETVVIANPRGATRSNFFVVTGSDGNYAFDMLAGGAYTVSVMIGPGGYKPKDVHFQPVTVVPGRKTRKDIAIHKGSASLTVHVKTDDGAPVRASQVAVLPGVVEGEDPALTEKHGEFALPPVAPVTIWPYARGVEGAEPAGVLRGC